MGAEMKARDSRVAIVTGAAGMRGIGRAIALRFARDGLRIVLVDIERSPAQMPEAEVAVDWRGIDSVREEIVAAGGQALAVHADITDPAQVNAACERAIAAFGAIDVLVNNARAGVGRDRAPVVDLDPLEWDRVLAVNARGTFLFAQAVARHLVARGGPGRIINMSSLSGKRGLAGHAAYCASKFAIIGLTQVMALELGSQGITVNAICPGAVDTGRFSLADKLAAEKDGLSVGAAARQRMDARAKAVALGRVAESDDVAGMAAFLVSPDARHITGQAFNVCGGETFH
jgi:meso-butanediol dehydrogenase/(S,S)-butanediol dehydrogenase/diacetyl reductase